MRVPPVSTGCFVRRAGAGDIERYRGVAAAGGWPTEVPWVCDSVGSAEKEGHVMVATARISAKPAAAITASATSIVG